MWMYLSSAGAPETKAIKRRFKHGLLITEYQHVQESFEGISWDKALENIKFSPSHTVIWNDADISAFMSNFRKGHFWGRRIFIEENGIATMIAYHYDTSN
jgi:hypothetical protein